MTHYIVHKILWRKTDNIQTRYLWIKITNYDDLQPGDIVFMPGHVQIYAGKDSSGNSLWYNAGSDNAIQKENPYTHGDSYSRSKFESARRKP